MCMGDSSLPSYPVPSGTYVIPAGGGTKPSSPPFQPSPVPCGGAHVLTYSGRASDGTPGLWVFVPSKCLTGSEPTYEPARR